MKNIMEYKFDHISISFFSLYLLISFIVTFTLAAFVGSISNYDKGYSIYPVVTLVLLALFFYWIGKRVLVKKMTVKITDEQLIVNGKTFFLSDIKSFDQDSSNYLDLFSVKIENLTLKFNNPIRSKNHNDFLKFKKVLQQKINSINKSYSTQIKEVGFYNSKYAKPLMYFILLVLIIWALGMIFKPENFRISNFILFVLVLAGIIPVLFKTFSKRNNK